MTRVSVRKVVVTVPKDDNASLMVCEEALRFNTHHDMVITDDDEGDLSCLGILSLSLSLDFVMRVWLTTNEALLREAQEDGMSERKELMASGCLHLTRAEQVS
ncbi:hypothetical protein PHSY_006024 [Pseudozyma hubeiensis SY62]|uniref:Uncharacterized protein n=1 Tax=Pseudozyma hubeiensis (strain SY62) TaxID=1305764 RepID=R9PK06_PSEHS|nr:hypothetical protein PHSY_006024 [Pseudozyma hubeiensis SY62]GAC98430.1 hypothetical protein PHSY_006024 [Pseudozyma hubeiensis SY62]